MFCVCVREKYTLEQDIRDTEEAIRHKSAEVQVRANCSMVNQLQYEDIAWFNVDCFHFNEIITLWSITFLSF